MNKLTKLKAYGMMCDVLMCCWIEGGAAVPHPTAPPARGGSIDELVALALCVLGELNQSAPWYAINSAISGAMVHG